jgi:hypothetical protein
MQDIQHKISVVEEDILFIAAEIQNKLGLPDTGRDQDQHMVGIMVLDHIKYKLMHGKYPEKDWETQKTVLSTIAGKRRD